MSDPESPLLPFSPPLESYEPGTRAIDLRDRPVAESLREVMASTPRAPQEVPAADQPPPLPPPFSNRHWTLAILGFFELLAAFIYGAQTVQALATEGWEKTLASGPEAVRLLWENPLGIAWGFAVGLGLIFARRWARRLAMAGWGTVMIFCVGMAVASVVASWPNPLKYDENAGNFAGWPGLVAAFAVGLLAWLFLAVLGHSNVRRTCEAAQPRADWTDRRTASQLLLMVMMADLAIEFAGNAFYQPWPHWGRLIEEQAQAAWWWGGLGAASLLAVFLLAAGTRLGALLALAVWGAWCSTVLFTAFAVPEQDFSHLWNGLDVSRTGGVAYVSAMALFCGGFALRALLAPRLPVSTAPADTSVSS